MRRAAWYLLLLYAFAVPWEYSLDLGAPLGNVARFVGLLLLLVAIPAALQRGAVRRPGALQWMTLALFLWVCSSFFWTTDQAATFAKMRGYAQEMMVVWIAWEFAENARDLKAMMRLMVGGCWVLAVLTVWSAVSPSAAGQIRFAAAGQDPNDVARYLDLGFPLAAVLLEEGGWRAGRLMALGYFPLGFVAVLLTASRGGFVAGLVALAGCCLVLLRKHRTAVLGTVWAAPMAGVVIWMALPEGIAHRISTIPQQLRNGDLNQRLNIWAAGWQAFKEAPLLGHGAGSFVSAAGLSPIDTAHNVALSIAVEMGLVGLALGLGVLMAAAAGVFATRGGMRSGLTTALLVWLVLSMVGTTAESRTTWLLFAIAAVAGRVAAEENGMEVCGRSLLREERACWSIDGDTEPAQ